MGDVEVISAGTKMMQLSGLRTGPPMSTHYILISGVVSMWSSVFHLLCLSPVLPLYEHPPTSSQVENQVLLALDTFILTFP